MAEATSETQPFPSTCCSPKNRLICIFTGLVLIAVFTITGFLLGKNLSQSKTLPIAQVSPTPVLPTPTINPTANWKTYRNEKYGFEVKYYPELTLGEWYGGSETAGQFTYLQSITFGTGREGVNYRKSQYGFEVKIDDKFSLEDFRIEIVGHVADKIDSEEEIVINNNTWTKINYKIFLTTDYVLITSAIINQGKYSYEIIASALDIDLILSTFKFLE